MSYTIEYNRQFIRSKSGITPVWLCGDSNVWEGPQQHMRRCRSWSCFGNLLGASESELMEFAKSLTGGQFQVHWKKNGKYLDDAALLRWMGNGIKTAAALEDILAINYMRHINCHLSVWGEGLKNTRELEKYCGTTAELDEWIVDAKARIAELRAEGRTSVYPIIDFGREDIKHPMQQKRLPGRIILKKRGKYLGYGDDGYLNTFYTDIRKAAVFTKEKWEEMQKDPHVDSWVKQAIPVDAAIKEFPYDAVIRFKDGPREGKFVSKRTPKRLGIAYSIDSAKHYPNKKAAERAMAKMQFPFRHCGTMEVVLDTTRT